MNNRPPLDPESALLAAELALGLLEPSEAREALLRHGRDRDFAAEAWLWQAVTDGWLQEIEPVEPPSGVLGRIEARLDDAEHAATTRPSYRESVWRTWALAGMAASVALAVTLGVILTHERSRPVTAAMPEFAGNVTQISSAGGIPMLSAVYDGAEGKLLLRVADLSNAGKVPELWLIPPGGKPHSLGLLTANKLTIEISPALRAQLIDGASLAITRESPEGAPHAAPTGPILGAGKLQSL